MNKKIFIVLALASLFVFTQATNTAVACADTNCAACTDSSAGSCTACATTYFLTVVAATPSSTCSSCATGCATCTSLTACTACNSGFFLSADKTTCTACATGSAGTDGCSTCASAGAVCSVALPGYATITTPAAPTVCGDTAAKCAICTDGVAAHCTKAAAGYFLAASTTGTPAVCGDTAAKCSVCSDTTAGHCTTPAVGYTLAGATSATPVVCSDSNCNTCPAAAATCTGCAKGTPDTNGLCCGVKNCGTCAAVATVTNANNVCTACASGYGIIYSATVLGGACATCSGISAGCSKCDASGTSTTVGACSACKSGYTNSAASGAAAVCVASTPNPTTDSPSTAAFNVTPTATFLSTETSTPAFTGISGPVVHGPGFDSSTEYVWALVVPTTTGVVSVNRRTLNGTYGGSLGKVNGTADVAITTAVASTTAISQTAVAPGYFAFASYVAGVNWGGAVSAGVAGTATASEISVTYIAVNGSSATTKAITSNTNTNVYFQINSLWIDTGVIYITYAMATHTAGAVAASGVTAATDTFAVNGIYIQGITISTGALLYNTTGGVKAITITQSVAGTTGTTCVKTGDTGCASNPLTTYPVISSVASFTTGGTNITNSTTVNYLWSDKSGTGNYQVIKTGTITLATGAATSGTALSTEAAATGTFLSATTAAPYVSTSYYPAGFLGSFATSGVFIGKLVATFTGAATPAYTYTLQGYINGSSTAAGNVTLVSGYMAPLIQGYGTSDGFVLVETHSAQTTPTNKQGTLVQIERFFTNGSTNGAAVSLGTYQDAPLTHQDGNGSIYLGYYTQDQNSGKTYTGMLGKYLAQSLASGASTLTSIFALLSLMIVALFAF